MRVSVLGDNIFSLVLVVHDIKRHPSIRIDIGLLTVAAFGKWRDNQNIVLTKSNQVRVQSSKDLPGILDGEKVNLGRSAEINFVSKAVTVLVPASS
jgi:diacylglycerol kinase family enzyme